MPIEQDIASLLDKGFSQQAILAQLSAQAEQRNRAQQTTLAEPPAQDATHWAARKAWLLDGQAIHGEIKEFFYPALAALKADDQVGYSRNRDLLFKALRTFLGDGPPQLPILKGPTK